MKLAYHAYDVDGRAVRDVIDAASQDEATALLRKRGLFVAQLQQASGAQRSTTDPPRSSSRRRPRARAKNLAVLTRQFYILLSTGTPLIEAIEALSSQTRDPGWQAVMSDIAQRIERGSSLSEAMEHHPQCFDRVYRSLIAAGESSGKLTMIFDRLSQLTRKQLAMRTMVLGALVYPSVLLVVALGVTMLMLTVVLPRFSELFETLAVPLPPTTALLMSLGTGLREYWWVLLLTLGGSGVGLWRGARTSAGRRLMHRISLDLPQIGRMTRGLCTARIIRLLGTLSQSYLPLLEVLELVRDASGNDYYAELLDEAHDCVTRGEPISEAFAASDLISPSVSAAMRSGEASGKVGESLLNIAELMDEENEVLVKTTLSILEPAILLLLGVLVGFMALSMFLPLFDLAAQSGGG